MLRGVAVFDKQLSDGNISSEGICLQARALGKKLQQALIGQISGPQIPFL